MGAIMRRLCFGLVLFGLTAVVTHAALSEEGIFVSRFDLLTIQPVHADTARPVPYRFSASVVLTNAPDNVPGGLEFGSISRLPPATEPKKETVWATNARWQLISGGEHVSLSPLLRFAWKGERLEIKPRRHSVWVEWRKALP